MSTQEHQRGTRKRKLYHRSPKTRGGQKERTRTAARTLPPRGMHADPHLLERREQGLEPAHDRSVLLPSSPPPSLTRLPLPRGLTRDSRARERERGRRRLARELLRTRVNSSALHTTTIPTTPPDRSRCAPVPLNPLL
jgi:hypothetical protein